MTEVRDKIKKAKDLKKEGSYQEASVIFEDIWLNHREDCSKWEGWSYAYCLRKVERYHEALDVCREVYMMDSTFDHNNSLYAWCVYFTEVAHKEYHDENVLFQAVRGITRLCKPDNKFAPYKIAIFKLLDYLNSKPTHDNSVILHWLDQLPIEHLSKEPEQFTDREGKDRELASEIEKYYSLKTKALFELGHYEECIDSCEAALASIEKVHYDNDVWFNRLIGLSQWKLGEHSDAVETLKPLLKKRKESFIHKEIAEILFEQEKYKEALSQGVEGVYCHGSDDKKLNLYQLISDILTKQGKTEPAKKHLELVLSIRLKEGWKIKQDLKNKAHILQIDIENLLPYRDIRRELSRIWEDLKFEGQTKYYGSIQKILPNGKAGFIQDGYRNRYYFEKREFKAHPRHFREGKNVSYYLIDSFDKKRGRKSQKAINVKLSR